MTDTKPPNEEPKRGLIVYLNRKRMRPRPPLGPKCGPTNKQDPDFNAPGWWLE